MPIFHAEGQNKSQVMHNTQGQGNRILSEFTKQLEKKLYIIRDVNYLDTLILLEMFMENKNVCNMKTHLSQHCASGIAIIDQCTPRQFLYEVIPHQLKRQKKKKDV